MSRSVFRFAPSPNGYLHLGHALSALINFEMARAAGGRLLLRIEDIDQARCRPEYEEAIYEDLAWLGIAWEQPVRRQSAHFDDYRAALARLDAARPPLSELREPERDRGARRRPGGARAVAARSRRRAALSRRRALTLAGRAPPAHGAGKPYALRLDMSAAIARAGPLTWTETGSGPAARADRSRPRRRCGATWCWRARTRRRATISRSSSTTRGKASPMSCAGRTCSGRPACTGCCRRCSACPRRHYHHHRLILDADGHKLSKSTRATALRALRDGGASPADIRRMIGLA